MIYELRKIFSNRSLLLLLLGAILANGFLFYRHCMSDSKGYTLSQVQQIYDLPMQELEEQKNLLLERGFLEDVYDDSLLTGDVYREASLYADVIDRKNAILNYRTTIADLKQETEIKQLFFASGDMFSAETLQKATDSYQAMENIHPVDSFSGATEVIGDWRISDLLVLLFGCTAGLVLLTQERAAGLLCLLRPTRYGHGRLLLRKAAAMCGLLLLGFAAIYGTNFGIAAALFGFGDLNRAVQSVYGFTACTHTLSVGAYLVIFLAGKLLFLLASSSLFFLLCTAASRAVTAVLGGAVLAGAAFLMGRSGSLWLRALSLTYAGDIMRQFSRDIYLNFFGHAIPFYSADILLFALLPPLAIGSACLVFCRQPALTGAGKLHFRLPSLHSTKEYLHEGWKLLFLNGGLAVLLLLGAVQCLQYQDFAVDNGFFEQAYRSYSHVLSGSPTEEKDDYLSQEAARYAQLQEKAAGTSDDIRREAIEREMRPMWAFERAEAQYRSLSGTQRYVYASGYERLYGGEGLHDDLENTALLVFALVLVLSGLFSVEAESGMQILQCSAGKQRNVTRNKLLWTATFLCAAMLIAYLPQLLCVVRGYGLPQLSAQANSLPLFGAMPDFVPFWGVLALTGLARLLVSAMAAALILIFSKKTGSTIAAILLSAGLLLLPLLLVLLW